MTDAPTPNNPDRFRFLATYIAGRSVDVTEAPASDLGIEEAVLDAVRKALKEIEYGSILLKIHQGQVVGIETSTKLRLDG